MQRITTRFTKLMDIQSPIVAAPMAFASTPSLAAAVTASGAFGFIGAGFDSSKALKQKLQDVRTSLSLPDDHSIPVGVGFLGWILDKTETSDDPRIANVLDERPVAVWFAFGTDLGQYVAQVKAHDARRSHKTIIFVIVNSVAEALQAANDWKVDVLVVQGTEAGGHGGAKSPPLSLLLTAVLSEIPDGPPVIAAGGVATGAQIASLLTLGASGVALGTRFLYTHECQYSPAMKDVLLEADLNATERSMAFDEVNRTTGWPEHINGRAIANSIMDDFNQGLELEERMKRFDESKVKGENSRLVIWAGTGVGLTSKIQTAAEVVRDLRTGTVNALREAAFLLQ